MRKLRVTDPIIVIAGKHKGKISTIAAFDDTKVYVKGVNEVKRAQKWKWYITKTLPLHISNIMYYNEIDKTASRVKISLIQKKKKRVLTKSGKELGKD